jgi:hypothetical protein
LKDEYVAQVGDAVADHGHGDGEPVELELEDIVPASIAAAAVVRYIGEFTGDEGEADLQSIEGQINESTRNGHSVFKSSKAAVEADGRALSLTKIGFARSVVEVLQVFANEPVADGDNQTDLNTFEVRVRRLFSQLNRRRRKAERELADERVSHRIERAKQAFLRDHQVSATREEAEVLLQDMEEALDENSPESDPVRLEIQRVRREYKLEVDLTKQLDDFDAFKSALEKIQYAPRNATQEKDEGDYDDHTVSGDMAGQNDQIAMQESEN